MTNTDTKHRFTRHCKTGTTLNVFVGSTGHDEEEGEKRVSETIKKALSKGLEVTLENGDITWVESIPIVDPSRDDSEAFIWDKTGDKVKHDRVQFTLSQDGNKTRETIGTSWKGL